MEELEETIEKPKSLDEIILSLKILANIKYNDKLCIRNNCLSINSWAILRYYNNDSRESTIQYLEKLYTDLSNEIEKLKTTYNNKETVLSYFTEDPSYTLLNVCHNLKLSQTGIYNLLLTYNNDIYTKSRLEILQKNIDLKIRKISELLVLDK